MNADENSNRAYFLASVGGEFQPIAASGRGRPRTIGGQPVHYFWKDLIHTGDYVHPLKQFRLPVNAKRITQWAATGKKMLDAGVRVPITADHSDSARDTLGRVIEFKVEADALWGLCQLIGDDAAKMAARNDVSVAIDPEFVDGQARDWGNAIVHVALTPVPVVPGLGDFVQAASREAAAAGDVLTLAATESKGRQDMAQRTLTCSDACMGQLHQLVPGLQDASDEEKLPRIAQHLSTLDDENDDDEQTGDGASDDDADGDGAATDGQSVSRADGTIADVRAELDSARRQIAELSARAIKPIDPEIAGDLVDAVRVRRDLAVARGALTPAVADRLFARLVKFADGRVNSLALSRAAGGGDMSLAMGVFSDLAENQPLASGEATGLQALSRAIPGADANAAEGALLQKKMIALASGKTG